LVTPQLPFSSYYPYYPYYPEPYYSQPAYSTVDESANNAQINSLTAEIQRLTAEVQQLQDELAAARTPPVQPSSLQVVPSTTPAPVIPVVLVYRDGHQVEIQGYAIMGQILWTTRQDGFKKIPLSDLNLDSTREENLKRGVNFMPER